VSVALTIGLHPGRAEHHDRRQQHHAREQQQLHDSAQVHAQGRAQVRAGHAGHPEVPHAAPVDLAFQGVGNGPEQADAAHDGQDTKYARCGRGLFEQDHA
jgi:hypothetical protein